MKGSSILGVGAGLALKGGGGLVHERQHEKHFGAGFVDDCCVASPA